MHQHHGPREWQVTTSSPHRVVTFPLLAAALCGITMAISCSPPQSEPTIATISRQDAIPSDAQKIMPSSDDHPPILHSPDFLQPEPVTGGINTAGAEDSAFVIPDGTALYFFFTPDVRIPPEKQLLDGVTGIYVSQWLGNTWAEAQRVPLQDQGTLALDGCVFVKADNMWFCSAREGNYRGMDMWTAKQQSGSWGDWKNAGEQVNVDYQVGEMHITSDGKQLYYHSDRPGGKGGMDIWVMERQGEGWGAPQNVAPVNTPETDGWPFVTADGTELWLTRTYMGTPALYRSRMSATGWKEPELIVSQFAGEASLDNAGNLYFTHHFFHDGEMLEADIYVAHSAG
ncbi:MAG: PD40 domain-containing protein [Dehalococcoidia bacterium]|nr:PD40 domain-containing protein [Dehalococcoidia bacterium]